MSESSLSPGEVMSAVRERAPLVHCVTGGVTINLMCDGLLAAGARPLATSTLAEAPTLVRGADALLASFASLTTDSAEALLPTVRSARDAGVPWVFDPAAVGPAPVRTQLAPELLAQRPTVVRANASEIAVLAGRDGAARGADSHLTPDDVLDVADRLATEYDCVVSVSGEVDLVTDGRRRTRVHSGHPLLTRVTGTGCLLGALTAACAAVVPAYDAAVAAAAWLAVASEEAAHTSRGPGSFKVALSDELDLIVPTELDKLMELS